jgi:hypothetical protein
MPFTHQTFGMSIHDLRLPEGVKKVAGVWPEGLICFGQFLVALRAQSQ